MPLSSWISESGMVAYSRGVDVNNVLKLAEKRLPVRQFACESRSTLSRSQEGIVSNNWEEPEEKGADTPAGRVLAAPNCEVAPF